MKTIACIALAAIALLATSPASRADDSALLDRFELKGERRKCLQSYDIDETEVIDESHVLFRVGVKKYYVNRLSRPCPALEIQRRFRYTLRGISELCSGDAITVIDGVGMGPGCILGPFEAAEKKRKQD